MSPGPEFFELPPVRRILERAALGAGVPLSVHPFANNREGAQIASWGRCEACAYVNGTPAGERACRQSRRSGSILALGQEAPNTYPCHLGLGVVAIAPRALPGFVLTFGPYCPAAETRGIENAVCAGLSELLGEDLTEAPFSLDDIHRTPKGALTAVAEWTAEALNREAERLNAPPAAPEPAQKKTILKRAAKTESRPVHEEIAVALSGGEHGPLREYLRACLDEAGERATAARRGGAVSMAVSRLLEVCHGAGADLSAAWTAFADFAAKAPGYVADRALIDAAARVLDAAKWPSPAAKPAPSTTQTRITAQGAPQQAPATIRLNDAELNRILLPRFAEGVALSEVAQLLGVSPSAITHRLQRRFGLSYSEYLGRLRAEKAKELLRRTRLNIAEVATRVGISDPSNLGRLFRRHVGMSPAEYRTRYGAKP
jgi:AraC-like DNA-binding protein